MHVHAPSRPWNSPSVKFGIKAILIRAKAVLNRAGAQAPTRGVTPVSLSFAFLAASTKALYSSLATEDLWALGRIKKLPSGVQYHATKQVDFSWVPYSRHFPPMILRESPKHPKIPGILSPRLHLCLQRQDPVCQFIGEEVVNIGGQESDFLSDPWSLNPSHLTLKWLKDQGKMVEKP